MRPRPRSWWTAVAGSVALLAAPLAGVSAAAPAARLAAHPVARVAGGPAAAATGSASLVLAPPQLGGVERLAGTRGLSRARRRAELSGLLPGAGQRADAVRVLTALGLHVTRSDALVVTVSGPQAVLNRLFDAQPVGAQLADTQPAGAQPAGAQPAGAQPVGAAGRLYTAVPLALHGLVSAVFGGTTTRPFAHPVDLVSRLRPRSSTGPDCSLRDGAPTTTNQPTATCGFDAAQLRALYGLPAAVSAPPTGASETVATIQLSGWDATDLVTFAAGEGHPLRSGQYRAVSVDDANPAAPDGMGGDQEVALDQEMLLATAPYADQQAYFAPNSSQGELDALSEVFDASSAGQPDNHLAALSDSWGGCEVDTFNGTPSGTFSAADMQQARAFAQMFAYIEASGTTVLAASGDDGENDGCSSTIPGRTVDYPASDPSVLAVGGTTAPLNADGSVSTDPTTQTAWDDLGYGGGAAGGGESLLFPPPSYQSGLSVYRSQGVSSAPLGRAVPDIAADADPYPGFDMYTTDPSAVAANGGPWQPIGGTSMAAPMVAGMLTDELLAAGYSQGVGDLHPALYQQGRLTASQGEASGLVDITNSGAAPVGGTTVAEPAGPGYDEITGLGTPQWNLLYPRLVGAPALTLARGVTDSRTVALEVSAPSGVSYTGFSPAVVLAPGVAPPSTATSAGQAACRSHAASATAPTSVTLPAINGRYSVVVFAATAASCYEALATVLLDTTPPVVSVPRVSPAGGPAAVTASWIGTDPGAAGRPPTGSGIADYTYRLLQAGRVVLTATTTATTVTLPVVPAAAYQLVVTAVDRAGNRGGATWSGTAPVDDRQLTAGAGWAEHVDNPSEYGDGARIATGAGDDLSYAFAGSVAEVIVTETDTSGLLDVMLNGVPVATIDLYSARTRYRVPLVVLARARAGRYLLRLRVDGRHDAASHGDQVVVDALVVR